MFTLLSTLNDKGQSEYWQTASDKVKDHQKLVADMSNDSLDFVAEKINDPDFKWLGLIGMLFSMLLSDTDAETRAQLSTDSKMIDFQPRSLVQLSRMDTTDKYVTSKNDSAFDYILAHAAVNPTQIDMSFMNATDMNTTDGLDAKTADASGTSSASVQAIACGGGYIASAGCYLTAIALLSNDRKSITVNIIPELKGPTMQYRELKRYSQSLTQLHDCHHQLLEELVAIYPVMRNSTDPDDVDLFIVLKRETQLHHFKLPEGKSGDNFKHTISCTEESEAKVVAIAKNVDDSASDGLMSSNVMSQSTQRLSANLCGFNQSKNTVHVMSDTLHRTTVYNVDGVCIVVIRVGNEVVFREKIDNGHLHAPDVERVIVAGGRCVVSTRQDSYIYNIYNNIADLSEVARPCLGYAIRRAIQNTTKTYGFECEFIFGPDGSEEFTSHPHVRNVTTTADPWKHNILCTAIKDIRPNKYDHYFAKDNILLSADPRTVLSADFDALGREKIVPVYSPKCEGDQVPEYYRRPYDVGSILNEYKIKEGKIPRPSGNPTRGVFGARQLVLGHDNTYSGHMTAQTGASKASARESSRQPKVSPKITSAWEANELVYERFETLFSRYRHPFLIPPIETAKKSIVCVKRWTPLTPDLTVKCLRAAWAFCATHKTAFPLRRFHMVSLYLLQKSAQFIYTNLHTSLGTHAHPHYHDKDDVTHQEKTADLCDFTGDTVRPIHLHSDFIRHSENTDVQIMYWSCCYLLAQEPTLDSKMSIVADPMDYLKKSVTIPDPMKYAQEMWRPSADIKKQEARGLIGLYNFTGKHIHSESAISVVANIVQRWMLTNPRKNNDSSVPSFLRPTHLDACYVCEMADDDCKVQDIHLRLYGRITSLESGFSKSFAKGSWVEPRSIPSCAVLGTDLASYAILYADTVFSSEINWQSAIPTVVRKTTGSAKSVELSPIDPTYKRLGQLADLKEAEQFTRHQVDSNQFTSPFVTFSEKQLRDIANRVIT
jgi:hypothetical protein